LAGVWFGKNTGHIVILTENNNNEGPFPVPFLNQNLTNGVNEIEKFDWNQQLNFYFQNDENLNPYTDTMINSPYFDTELFVNNFKNTKSPIFLSLNIQSLPSKYPKIKDLIYEFQANNIPIVAIALQEIWKIPVIDDMKIDGFNLFVNERKNAQGGGVAFYVLENTNSKIIKSLTVLDEKLFKSIGIEITLQGKKHVLLNFYRSPNPPKTPHCLLHLKFFLTFPNRSKQCK